MRVGYPAYFRAGRQYYPITLGHEFSGYVESYGTGSMAGYTAAMPSLVSRFSHCFHCRNANAVTLFFYANSISL
ncbi:alcohol dehydrogenase catalytic domain-containing protein [Salmonella enterica subsp. enterica serovar Weltevreden]|nr:alcohol dehydrogenase catalytic domain-containing protein [Salmonella enterica subsp. enterica serovar Weltevreden]